MTERFRETIKGGFFEPTSLSIPGTSIVFHGAVGERSRKFILDTATPNFTSLLKCGEFLPLNPVTIATELEVRSTVECDISSSSNPLYRLHGDPGCLALWAGPPAFPDLTDFDSNAIAVAVTAARANVQQEKWDFLTFLAELRSSVDTLATVARGFWSATHDIAETARKVKKEPWKKFRELWLLGRYGIRPIAYDFRDASRAVAKVLEGAKSQLLTGKGIQEVDVPGSFTQTSGEAYGIVRMTQSLETGRLKCTYRSAAYVEVNGDWNDILLVDPLVTAWELIPFSFVLDWVVNVGAWVSTLTPTLRGEFLGTSASVKIEGTNTKQHLFEPWASGTGSMGAAAINRTTTKYIRWPYTGIPPPGFDPNLSLPKLIDLLALCYKGRKKTYAIMNRR